MITNLDKKIESYLFWKADIVTENELISNFKISDKKELQEAITKLESNLQDRGVELKKIEGKNIQYALVTSAENSEIIEELIKDDLNKELSKATLETLSIVIYRGPIKRPDIDYIRGVSSQFTLRNLLVRGLVEKIIDPRDSRTYLYKPSIELLNYMGIDSIDKMPEYKAVNSDIDNFMNDSEESTSNSAEQVKPEE